MSKLSIIRKSLEENSELEIVKYEDFNYVPEKDGRFSQRVHFWVVPKNGLYKKVELEKFMIGLIPRIKPIERKDFVSWKGGLEFGMLIYDEIIGKSELKKYLKRRGIENDKIENEYFRRIFIRVYPCKEFVEDVLNGKLRKCEFRADSRVLERYGLFYQEVFQ